MLTGASTTLHTYTYVCSHTMNYAYMYAHYTQKYT